MRTQPAKIGNIRRISAKKFEILVEGTGDKSIVHASTSLVSTHNQMNSSMEFVYQSIKRPDKEFKLRLFRNGML